MANNFNASQDKCYVEPIYQGSYDDALNKLRASLQSEDVPAVMQLYDIGTRLMADLGMITLVQEFIDKDNYDVSDLEPNVWHITLSKGSSFYAVQHITPMLYYNKDMFCNCRFGSRKPAKNLPGSLGSACVWTQKDAGNVTVSGSRSASTAGSLSNFWRFRGYYVNNANRRDALAAEATFNSPEGVAILEWWKAMFDEGIMGNYGRVNADVRTAFYAEQTAMFIDSPAVLRGQWIRLMENLRLALLYMPRPNEEAFETSGTIIGGGSLWIISDSSPEEQDCAWEFIKYQASPEQQAYWHTMSGYFPIRDTAYDVPLAQEWREQYPQFKTAVDQLHLAPNNRITQGGLIGVFPTARQTIEEAIEEVLEGVATPQEALD